MKYFTKFTLIMLCAIALFGCGPKEEKFVVDPNDPSSVANASKVEPTVIDSRTGQPIDGAGATAVPPEKD